MKVVDTRATLYDDRSTKLASKQLKQPPSLGDELDFEFYEVCSTTVAPIDVKVTVESVAEPDPGVADRRSEVVLGVLSASKT